MYDTSIHKKEPPPCSCFFSNTEAQRFYVKENIA
jgi:hypothetical protein